MKRRTEQSTPLTSIKTRIENLTSDEQSKELVILLSTGSYNPVHNMHIGMIQQGLLLTC
jgi:hypothetical protein